MQIEVRFMQEGGVVGSFINTKLTHAEFCQLYFSGKCLGWPIVSMLWTDKSETYKLIFGD